MRQVYPFVGVFLLVGIPCPHVRFRYDLSACGLVLWSS
jgi:hypothetical protein